MRVSVTLTSCNRDRFLIQAIDSVLAQRTSFPFELVIGDDASRPPTREILLGYQERHPETIRLLLHESNLGLARNFASILEQCLGEYVALLDDDDYWTSTDKLQRQADYLDAHQECAMCFHDTRHFHEDGSAPDYPAFLRRKAERYGFDDLRRGGFIPTSTTFLRRSAVTPLPAWFAGLRSHEWTLHLLAASRGEVGYLDAQLAATRIHAGGKWNSKTPIQQLEQVVHNTSILEANLPGMKSAVTDALLSRTYFELAQEHRRLRDFDRAAHWSLRSLRKRVANPWVPLTPRVRLLFDSAAHALDARIRFRRRG